MPRFTISQLGGKNAGYALLDTDLMLLSIGTATYDLSSTRVSLREFGDYIAGEYSTNNTLTVAGQVSAMQGLSAVSPNNELMISLSGLPGSPTDLKPGDLYTQAGNAIDSAGISVVCIVPGEV